MNKHLLEVEKALKTTVIDDPAYANFRSKCTNLKVLGHRLPLMHEIEEDGFSFYKLSKQDILKTWTYIWNNSEYLEPMYLPLFYYRRHLNDLDKKAWKTLKAWVNRVENWEHADALCALYSVLLERFPKLIEPTLRTWNKSKNPWKMRCSIVSTIYYASKNRKAPPLKLVFELATPLIKHKDPYIQKGVGWQLREAYKLDPKRTLAFINKHLLDLPATAFSYATERVPKDEKAKMKAKRKAARTKK
jgi:3-methyladenine DNA glycosylase AlkD